MCGNRMDRQAPGSSLIGLMAAFAVFVLGVGFVLPRTGFGGIWGFLAVMLVLKFAQSMLAWRPADNLVYGEEDDFLYVEDEESIEGRLERIDGLRRKELISEGEFAALRERVLEEV